MEGGLKTFKSEDRFKEYERSVLFFLSLTLSLPKQKKLKANLNEKGKRKREIDEYQMEKYKK